MKELPINQIICGDCLKVMKSWHSESIDMCMTSPPYWSLRDYEEEGQYGLEKTPEEYIEKMTKVFNEVKRVLKKRGTLWLNIGDTYYRDPKRGNQEKGGHAGLSAGRNTASAMQYRASGIMKEKCLCMIPERLAWSLIQNGWILRNKIIWYKPNGMPSSVKDRFSNRYEFVYMFSKSQRYYFDLDGVREPTIWDGIQWGNVAKKFKDAGLVSNHEFKDHPKGKNPGDVWDIPTVPCPVRGIHFATFPEDLCRKAIIPGCPEEVCKKCGKPRERIRKRIGEVINQWGKRSKEGQPIDARNPQWSHREIIKEGIYKTIGWTSCDCNAGFEGGIVLDPFCGVGTACYVARKLGRKYIGIDIKPEFCEKAENERLAQGVL